jgi:bacterioferritin-associated ferredoxin
MMPHREGLLRSFMIVCSCNVLSDHDVRHAVNTADDALRNAKQIFDCLGCSAECGRCARTIKTIIGEAHKQCALACQAGCQLRRIKDDAQDVPKLAPAAPNSPGFAA